MVLPAGFGGAPVDREEYGCPCGGQLWKYENPKDRSELWHCDNCDGRFEITVQTIVQLTELAKQAVFVAGQYRELVQALIKQHMGPTAFAKTLVDGAPETCHCGVKITPEESKGNGGICVKCLDREMADVADDGAETLEEYRMRVAREEQAEQAAHEGWPEDEKEMGND